MQRQVKRSSLQIDDEADCAPTPAPISDVHEVQELREPAERAENIRQVGRDDIRQDTGSPRATRTWPVTGVDPYLVSPYTLSQRPLERTSSLPFQEACLVRCFVERLASAFDPTDRFHHYSTVVPIRALKSPLLLNAICTAAARYLYQVCSEQNPGSQVEYDGIPLPDLTEKSALHYHNACIPFLIEVMNDASISADTEVLIAITILRYHEQVDTQFTQSDQETYMNAVQAIFKAQRDEEPDLLHFVLGQTQNQQITRPVSCPLRISACLIALRQEIWSVLIYRRPFRLPVSLNHDYMNVSKAVVDDVFDWTNRILVWCIYVLKICFLDDDDVAADPKDAASRSQQLSALRAFEQEWDTIKPTIFDPIYHRPRDVSAGRYFPQSWMTDPCQVVALQHIELGRIVLASHDLVARRIGIGASAAQRTQESIFRDSTRTICGLALSNSISQPALVTAGPAITLCGEYFVDRREQDALLDILRTLRREHAWPTRDLAAQLIRAWATSDD
ncbi:hypothetical protein E8E14_003132 [Neopestalotiopsis sp. 37M]|nr:hypothetical protein E8E14_003132 [Neopestalotiopsis sp. 37M]